MYQEAIRQEVKMLYTHMTQKAMKICYEAHRGQKDKGGIHYVFHPFHLAEQMETEEEICAALLHDVAEDTEWTLERLGAEGFSSEIMEALRLLTHDDETPYLDYVRRLRDHPIASRVKLADLRHNSTVGRLRKPGERDRQRLRKYLRAQAILTGGDADTEEMTLTLHLQNGAVFQGAELSLVLEPDGRVRAFRAELPDGRTQSFDSRDRLLHFLEKEGLSVSGAVSVICGKY